MSLRICSGQSVDAGSSFHVLASSPIITAYLRAGARKKLWYRKEEVGAVIVTCGGICPGLNNIIREIVVSFYSTIIQLNVERVSTEFLESTES